MNITSNEFVSNHGENKNFITVKHFQGKIKFSWGNLEIKMKVLKIYL